ncbi:hypothetical protein BD770DRAFT_449880 [Pilaira anomala]|nr:hypothetical protein BD770DRAFT_449880 [Pilaira anomala]
MQVPTELTFDQILEQRTHKQINTLQLIRKSAIKRIESSQKSQKEAIDKKLLQTKKSLKPAFKIGDIVEKYRDYKGTSWAGKLEDLWDGLFVITEYLKKGSYVIQGTKKDGTTDIKIVHGNRLRIYKLPDVGWKLEEKYKKTQVSNLEEDPPHLETYNMNWADRETNEEAANKINARLGPIGERSNNMERREPAEVPPLELSEFDKLYKGKVHENTVTCLDDLGEISEGSLIYNKGPAYRDEYPFNLSDLDNLGLCGDEPIMNNVTDYPKVSVLEQMKNDAREYEARLEQILLNKTRNEVILKRMATNVVRVCHEQMEHPRTQEQ